MRVIKLLLIVLISYTYIYTFVIADEAPLTTLPEDHYITREDERLCVIPENDLTQENCTSENQTNDHINFNKNDTIPNPSNTKFVLVKNVEHGHLLLFSEDLSQNNFGYFTYNPESNFNGTDTFIYKLVDETDPNNIITSQETTVTINVIAENDPPETNELTFPDFSLGIPQEDIYEDVPIVLAQLAANDPDFGDVITYEIINQPEHGDLINLVATSGAFTYVPHPNFYGSDRFLFKARDLDGEESNVSPAIINILPVNDKPVINLSGSETIVIPLNGVFTEPGFSGIDIEDGDITDKVIVTGQNINTSILGENIITYTLKDLQDENLIASTTRKVIIVIPENDIDLDGILNTLDPDIDGDNIINFYDNDIDNDNILNQNDEEDDADKIKDDEDTTPKGIGSEKDLDGDNILNVFDFDLDGDGIKNNIDDDIDGDGILNQNDDDIDGDNILNPQDLIPNGPNENDYDADGIANDIDIDLDGDNILNIFDNDIDNDEITNNNDTDDDQDGQDDLNDHSKSGFSNELDLDNDGIINLFDPDVDGDGILNNQDNDDDNDGIDDDQDQSKTGLGKVNDNDGDEIPNNLDDDIDGDGIKNDQDNDKNGNTILDINEIIKNENEKKEENTRTSSNGASSNNSDSSGGIINVSNFSGSSQTYNMGLINLNSSTSNASSSFSIGLVLGTTTDAICKDYLERNTIISPRKKNDKNKVILLQKFLNLNLNLNIPARGNYGPLSQKAVKEFQKKYEQDILIPWGLKFPTSNVYLTTVNKINQLNCPQGIYQIDKSDLKPF